jgi:hypothetical protein
MLERGWGGIDFKGYEPVDTVLENTNAAWGSIKCLEILVWLSD